MEQWGLIGGSLAGWLAVIFISTIVVLLAVGGTRSGLVKLQKIIEFMLGPSVVALGLLLYDHIDTIRLFNMIFSV